jgi:hypothetical protein
MRSCQPSRLRVGWGQIAVRGGESGWDAPLPTLSLSGLLPDALMRRQEKGGEHVPSSLQMLADGDASYGSTGIPRHCTPLAVTSTSRLSYLSTVARVVMAGSPGT